MARVPELLGRHIPYPELYEPEAVDYNLARQLLYSPRGMHVGENVSPVDLNRLFQRLTDRDILDIVAIQLGVPGKDIEKRMGDINEALSQAHQYLSEVLGLKMPSAQVHSKEDIVALVRKTTLYRKEEKKHLETHAGYCE